jgi:dolichol-phosphate mannosyltransferase
MMHNELISIILPCRNQSDHIADVIARYHAPLISLGIPYEMVVVPNACIDNTVEVIRNLAAKDARIRMIENPVGGWGKSVRVGLQAAKGTILIYTNSARTDPESLTEYIKMHLDSNRCLVKARRVARNAPLREIGSALYNCEAGTLFGIRQQDVNGTPKVISRQFYDSIQLQESGDLLDLELLALAKRRKITCKEIKVAGFKRHGGKSSTNLMSAFHLLGGAIRLRFSI